MHFINELNNALFKPAITEGMMVSISKVVSDNLNIPSGLYHISNISDNRCMLVSVDNIDKSYEVLGDDLDGIVGIFPSRNDATDEVLEK